MKNILLVSAHPDDMEIGMGGTAAKLADFSNLISVVLTDGRRSPNPFDLEPSVLANIRKLEAQRAASILGIQEILFLDLEDLKSSENQRAALQQLGNLIDHNSFSEIYTLHPKLDRHPTHQLTGKIVMECAAEFSRDCRVWAYEVWGLFSQWDRFEDISDTIAKKIQAISEHQSQLAAIPYTEGVVGLNRWRGIFSDPAEKQAQCAFAEIFLRLK